MEEKLLCTFGENCLYPETMPTKYFNVLKKVYEEVRLLKNLEIYFERIINQYH